MDSVTALLSDPQYSDYRQVWASQGPPPCYSDLGVSPEETEIIAFVAEVIQVTLYYSLLLPCLSVYRLGMWFWNDFRPRLREVRRHRATEKAVENGTPKPVAQRKRSLTLPLPIGNENHVPSKMRHTIEKTQVTKDQSQSTLFGRIPFEIREMIYQHALANSMHVHIFRRTDRRLGCYQCYSKHRKAHDLMKVLPGVDHPERSVTSAGAWIPGRCDDEESNRLLPLLKTCRRV